MAGAVVDSDTDGVIVPPDGETNVATGAPLVTVTVKSLSPEASWMRTTTFEPDFVLAYHW